MSVTRSRPAERAEHTRAAQEHCGEVEHDDDFMFECEEVMSRPAPPRRFPALANANANGSGNGSAGDSANGSASASADGGRGGAGQVEVEVEVGAGGGGAAGLFTFYCTPAHPLSPLFLAVSPGPCPHHLPAACSHAAARSVPPPRHHHRARARFERTLWA